MVFYVSDLFRFHFLEFYLMLILNRLNIIFLKYYLSYYLIFRAVQMIYYCLKVFQVAYKWI